MTSNVLHIISDELTPSEIENRMRYLPDVLLDEVGDTIIPSKTGIILPWFKQGLKWNDESARLPYSIWEAQAEFWNRLTQVSQWEELEAYIQSKWSIHSEHIFRVLNMNSFSSHTEWSRYVPYLTMWDKTLWNDLWIFKQKAYSILTSWPFGDERLLTKSKATEKLFNIRLQNEKTED